MQSCGHDALRVYNTGYLPFFLNLRILQNSFSYPDEPLPLKTFSDRKKSLEG